MYKLTELQQLYVDVAEHYDNWWAYQTRNSVKKHKPDKYANAALDNYYHSYTLSRLALEEAKKLLIEKIIEFAEDRGIINPKVRIADFEASYNKDEEVIVRGTFSLYNSLGAMGGKNIWLNSVTVVVQSDKLSYISRKRATTDEKFDRQFSDEFWGLINSLTTMKEQYNG